MRVIEIVALGAVLGAALPLAAAPEYDLHEGALRARDGESVLWEHLVVRPESRRSDSGLVGPVLARGLLHYCAGASLYAASPETGKVIERAPLARPCQELSADGDRVVVTIAPSRDGDGGPAVRYETGPGAPPLPFFLTGELLASRLPRGNATAVLEEVKREKPGAPGHEDTRAGLANEALAPWLEEALPRLAALQEWNPTNPWYPFVRGRYLHALGREDEARGAFQQALDVAPPYRFELLAMVHTLDAIDRGMADEAFRRALESLVARGYDPEMMATLINVLVYYGRPDEPLDPATDLDALTRLGERLWDVAPHVEMAAAFYNALASAHRRAGHADAGALWERRRDAVMNYRAFGLGGYVTNRIDPALDLALGCFAALLLAFVVKMLRVVPLQRRARGLARLNGFCVWSRGEIFGFLVVAAGFVVGMGVAAQGLSAVGRVAAVPLGALTGNWGHPDGVAYFSRRAGSPGGDFVHALALQKAGALDDAARIYERLPGPRAANNLGVIRHAQGRADDARRLWETASAAEESLAEARFNLGRDAASERVDRYRRYGGQAPLYAMPTHEMWDEALVWPLQTWNVFSSFDVIHELSDAGAATGPVRRAAVFEPWVLAPGLLLLVILAAVAGLFVRGPQEGEPTRISTVGWGLGFAIPGTAWHLGVLGPPALAAGALLWIAAQAIDASGGVAVGWLGAIATPHVARAFGAFEMAYTPLEDAIRSAAPWWWLVVVVNLLAVAVLEWWRPDPLGPRAHHGDARHGNDRAA